MKKVYFFLLISLAHLKKDKSVIKRKKTFEKSKKFKIIDYENNNNGRSNSFVLNNSSIFI